MKVRLLTLAEAAMERSPGQSADIFTADMVDQDDGGSVSVGYGRYGANQSLTETIVVDDIMIVLEGRLTVTSDDDVLEAGPGDIVYMPRGQAVTIRSHEQGAVTAYVTYPHWKPAHG